MLQKKINEFHVRVARTISHEFAALTRAILLLPLELLTFFFYYIDILLTAFLTIFRRFPQIRQNFSEGHTNVAENFQRLPKIAEAFRGRPEDASIIHQRI